MTSLKVDIKRELIYYKLRNQPIIDFCVSFVATLTTSELIGILSFGNTGNKPLDKINK